MIFQLRATAPALRHRAPRISTEPSQSHLHDGGPLLRGESSRRYPTVMGGIEATRQAESPGQDASTSSGLTTRSASGGRPRPRGDILPRCYSKDMTAPATSTAHPMTAEEWGALGEDIDGELVDGLLVEEEMPSAVHEAVVVWLLMLLSPYFRARGGFVFGSGIKLAVRAQGGRMPDVVCFGPGKKPESRGIVRVAPDIVVEVVSPLPADERRDRIEKPDDYAAFGVRYYWLLAPA